jgi:Icc-related predicted phosphoesterase
VRLLLVSDLHYTLRQLDWVVQMAPELDVVVIAGDHLDIASAVALEAQEVVIREYVERLSRVTTLVMSSGNHDLDATNDLGEKTAAWIQRTRALGAIVDGDGIDVDGWRLTVCPWWDGPGTRARLVEQLRREEAARARDDAQWAWVYHWPPDGAAVSATRRGHYGDADLLELLREFGPDLVLTGHVHESPFVADGSWAAHVEGALVLNAGHHRGPVPAHVVVDTRVGRASWWSQAGEEEIELLARVAPEPTSQ